MIALVFVLFCFSSFSTSQVPIFNPHYFEKGHLKIIEPKLNLSAKQNAQRLIIPKLKLVYCFTSYAETVVNLELMSKASRQHSLSNKILVDYLFIFLFFSFSACFFFLFYSVLFQDIFIYSYTVYIFREVLVANTFAQMHNSAGKIPLCVLLLLLLLFHFLFLLI